MTSEMASTHSKIMIETLLNVHALANMHRASERDEYRKAAADWLPALDRQMSDLRAALTRKDHPHDQG